jgi:hypothetical protein
MTGEVSQKTGSSDALADAVHQAIRRLRRVQISFADERADKRRAYMTEELQALLKTIPADQRVVLLDGLERSFPAGSGRAPVASDVVERASVTVEGLVTQLAHLASAMNDEERDALGNRLAAAGLLRGERTPSSSDADRPASSESGEDDKVKDALRYIAKSLKVERINMTRMANLAVMLAVYMVQLDHVVWSAWQTIAPRSGLKRKNSLEKAIRSYVSGDPAISGNEVNEQIATTKKLLTAFIAAIGQLGIQFTRQHLAQFAPQEIQLAVNRKGGSLLVGQDAASWALYQRMARSLEEGAVDDAVREIVAKTVADMLKT